MKYITYELNNEVSYGILAGEKIYNMGVITDGGAPQTLLKFIQQDFDTVNLVKAIESRSSFINLSDVKVKAPIPNPIREIICVGKNYADHANELKATGISATSAVPTIPVYFGKSVLSVIGPGEQIPNHQDITAQLDYEVELAVIIGKRCVNVSEADVEEYIFGYTIVNDVTARDLQTAHGQWYLGKSLAGFCPMGPVIVDKKDIPMPVCLNLYTKVNGELRQNSNTDKLVFGIPYLISQLSRGFTLYPGDIIATGTPAGVGLGFNPPKVLKPGDTVECGIEKIGVLINTVA